MYWSFHFVPLKDSQFEKNKKKKAPEIFTKDKSINNSTKFNFNFYLVSPENLVFFSCDTFHLEINKLK